MTDKRLRVGALAPALIMAVLSAGLLLAGCSGNTSETETAAETAAETQSSEADGAGETEEPAREEAAADAGAGTSEAENSEDGPLHPVIKSRTESEYDEDGSLLCSVSWQEPGIRDEGHEELRAALEAYAASRAESAAAAHDELLLAAEEGKAVMEEGAFYGYTSDSSIEFLRADDKVLSFSDTTYSFTGGAHGNGGSEQRVYDVRTGEELGLSDVVADKAALEAFVVDYLEENYGSEDMLLEGWEDAVAAAFSEGLKHSFGLTPEGIRISFDPYEIGPWALGTVTVDVPYTAEGIGFNADYMPAGEQTVWSIEPYEDIALDVDGDGTKESVGISFQVQEDQSQSTYTLYVASGEGEDIASINGVCGYGMEKAYIMKAPDGSYEFYGECRSDNDWRYLTMADLTELWTSRADGEAKAPSEYYESFYDNVPTSADSFYLSTRGSLISTVSISREHRVGESGFPEAVQEDFLFDGLELTAKQDVPGTSVDDDTEEIIIPSGTVLRAVSTDEYSYVIFELAGTGEMVKVAINGESRPHTAGDVDIEQCFEGLIFAG